MDRFILHPARELTLGVARFFARMHRGQINAYTAYVLLTLLVVLLIGLI
jgi:hypothetical protein